MKLSKKNQAKAEQLAADILRTSQSAAEARSAAYDFEMHRLNYSRSRTEWRIAEEVSRLVDRKAPERFARKPE